MAKRKQKTYLQLIKGFLGKRGWKKLTVEQRKDLRETSKSLQEIAKYTRKFPQEEYVNMNAEIEYERSMGRR